MATVSGKVLVAQGGGPTAVINQSVVGVVNEARRFPQVTHVYGAVHGVTGIKNEAFIDLTQETSANLARVAATPSSGLHSTREKPTVEDCQAMFKVMQAHDIRYFFYVGGNDSSETVRIIAEEAKNAKYDLNAVHVPKTVDNDLVGNDHTPGFGSAARYVASAFSGVNLDNRALPGVYIGVIMGRHAGFLTAASALARRFEDDGPHLVYVPERAFSVDGFVKDVKAVYEKFGRCVVAVSEGIVDSDGRAIIETLVKDNETDAFGNVQLSGTGALGDALAGHVREQTDIKRVRADTLGYLQRAFAGCVSHVDQREAREVGERAVQFALGQGLSGSVAIKRVGSYAVDYELIDIAEVAGKTRHMPDTFINADGNDVTQAFCDYCRPLIGDALTEIARFRAPAVKKLLS